MSVNKIGKKVEEYKRTDKTKRVLKQQIVVVPKLLKNLRTEIRNERLQEKEDKAFWVEEEEEGIVYVVSIVDWR